MIFKTLLEKLDTACTDFSLKESVCNQVQRIISTRMYLGSEPDHQSWVTAFGVPQIVDEHANVGDEHIRYKALLKQSILKFEPRVKNVEVKSMKSFSDRASCQLVLTLVEGEIEERFFF